MRERQPPNQLLTHVDRMLRHPSDDTKMPGLLVISDDDADRTAALQDVSSHHHGMLSCTLMPNSRYRDIYTSLDVALNGGFSSRRGRDSDRDILNDVKMRRFRLIIIDNAHFLLHGPAREQRVSIDTIKFVYNQLRVAMIIAGTQLLAERLSEYPEIMSRFQYRIDV